MKDNKNIDQFLNIEKKYGLYEKSINNIQYWIYARFSIWNYKICSEKLGLEKSYKKGRKKIPKFPFKNMMSEKNADLLFLNHPRRIQNQSYYECPYTERLSENYNNSITLERPYLNQHFKPVKTSRLLYTDTISLAGSLHYRIVKYLKPKEYTRIYNLVKEQIQQPLHEMKEAYSWTINENELYHFLVKEILLDEKEYTQYEKLLQKINPKVIVEVVYYCRQNMLINEIAKKSGIFTIELQHGTMHPEHAAYQYAQGARIHQFPDEIFLFSDFWKQYIQAPIPDKHLIATGYPFFEEKLQEYRKNKKTDCRKTLLFISQGTIGKYLSHLAVETAQLLSADKYRIIYKLHPSEYSIWKESYPYLHSDLIEVIDHNKESIYKYFSISDLQIGVYSTAIYEGLGFGLPTCIYRVGHYNVMEGLVSDGYAHYIDCALDVKKYLEADYKTDTSKVSFWKGNALQNMKNEIDKLLYEKHKK